MKGEKSVVKLTDLVKINLRYVFMADVIYLRIFCRSMCKYTCLGVLVYAQHSVLVLKKQFKCKSVDNSVNK